MKRISLIVFGLIFFLTSQAIAQNKVVVIPLSKSGVSPNQECPAGEAVTGFDRDGNIICQPFQTVLGQNWTISNFIITGSNVSNSCVGGNQYVKQSNFAADLFVGAMLCSASRYKLFLASQPAGPYYEISDTAGSGQDHCELIGGTSTTAIGATAFWSGEAGFYRHSLGDDFTFASPVLSTAFRTDWYECGINIP